MTDDAFEGPLAAELTGSTRAEQAREVERSGAVLSATLSFHCDACETAVALSAFLVSPSCQTCSRQAWRMEFVVTGTWGDEVSGGIETAGLLAVNAVGIAAFALMDAGFLTVGGDDEEQVRKWRRAWSCPEMPGEVLFRTARLPEAEVLHVLLEVCHGQESKERRNWIDAAREEGVHCVACRALFPPRSVLKGRKLKPLNRFSDDRVCSSKCLKAAQALSEAVCSVCEKAFVPPSKPLLKADWEPKVWHTTGHCSRVCHGGRDRKRTCQHCSKPFVIPKKGPLSRRGPKRWHGEGYCSKRCQEGKEASARLPKVELQAQLRAACAAGHELRLLPEHAGCWAYCPTCRSRFRA